MVAFILQLFRFNPQGELEYREERHETCYLITNGWILFGAKFFSSRINFHIVAIYRKTRLLNFKRSTPLRMHDHFRKMAIFPSSFVLCALVNMRVTRIRFPIEANFEESRNETRVTRLD